jgi:predicted oxidoreductase
MSTRREFLTQTAAASLIAAASTHLAPAAASAAGSESVSSLKSYKIPNTDLSASRLACGLAMLGWDWKDSSFVAKTARMIRTAYQQGITFFDTADTYADGKSESALGEVLRTLPGLRQKIVIQSKCGNRLGGVGSVDNSSEYILRCVEDSLQRLGTDYLDILLLHFPDSLVEPQEVAEAFERLHRSGKVRYFGVSNHGPQQIELLKKHVRQPIVANQIQLGLAYWDVRSDSFNSRFMHGMAGVKTLDYCRVQNIQVQAYSPLKGDDISKSPNLLRPFADASPEVKRTVEVLSDVAKNHGTTPAVIMLAWLLRHPAGIVPIIGATKAEYVIENSTADRIEITREEWYRLLLTAQTIRS